jgi:hypothetical protein
MRKFLPQMKMKASMEGRVHSLFLRRKTKKRPQYLDSEAQQEPNVLVDFVKIKTSAIIRRVDIPVHLFE